VKDIAPWAPSIRRFSDDGVRFFGAYGPKVVDQIHYVVDKLDEDILTRQAVINIWRERPPKTKDVPCTLSAQWMIRHGRLHVIDTMRSSDCWLGWPYDVFTFTMISLMILLLLRKRGIMLQLGSLNLHAASQHIYERNWEPARECLEDPEIGSTLLDEDDFTSPEDLLGFLSDFSHGKPTKKKFMSECV
jgi:thymidylate synthase